MMYCNGPQQRWWNVSVMLRFGNQSKENGIFFFSSCLITEWLCAVVYQENYDATIPHIKRKPWSNHRGRFFVIVSTFSVVYKTQTKWALYILMTMWKSKRYKKKLCYLKRARAQKNKRIYQVRARNLKPRDAHQRTMTITRGSGLENGLMTGMESYKEKPHIIIYITHHYIILRNG